MTIVSAPSDTAIERSADPDTVEREALARARTEEREVLTQKYTEQTRNAAQKRSEDGARAKVRDLYPGVKAELEARARARKITKIRIAQEIADQLNANRSEPIRVETVRGYIKDMD